MNRMKGMQGFFVVKVDLAEAYENLSLSFLNKVLKEIDFLDKLVQVIMAFIASMIMSIGGIDKTPTLSIQ